MNFIFNGPDRVVQGAYEVVNGVIEVDIQRELYSAWKEWVREGDNAKYLQAFTTTGGDPISATISVGSYFFLENGWKIRPADVNHRVIFNGNLFTRDDSSPYLDVPDLTIVTETRNSSLTQAITTSGNGSTPPPPKYVDTDGNVLLPI